MEKRYNTITWALLTLNIASTLYLTAPYRIATDTMQSNIGLFWKLITYLDGNIELAKQIGKNILLFISIYFLAYYAS